MKNLLIYINPFKCFDDEGHKSDVLVRIQIDNSFSLGWKREDILLVTNFDYEYNGVKAMVVNDDIFCTVYKYVSKINAIVHLFEHGLIGKELYWFHDLDAFQNNTILESELELGKVDAGFTDYGRLSRWNAGSFFFKDSAKDIFDWIKKGVYDNRDKPSYYYNHSEELILTYLTNNNFNNINERIKRLNITYNFNLRKISESYEKAIKPLKVLHFHPFSKIHNALAIAMYGRNRIHMPLMTERLIKIFNDHGIK